MLHTGVADRPTINLSDIWASFWTEHIGVEVVRDGSARSEKAIRQEQNRERAITQVMTAAVLAGSLSFSASTLAQAALTASENATPEPDNAVTLAIFET